MKYKNRPRCSKCGTFLFNDLSISVLLCKEHRPVLSPANTVKYRQFLKEYKEAQRKELEQINGQRDKT